MAQAVTYQGLPTYMYNGQNGWLGTLGTMGLFGPDNIAGALRGGMAPPGMPGLAPSQWTLQQYDDAQENRDEDKAFQFLMALLQSDTLSQTQRQNAMNAGLGNIGEEDKAAALASYQPDLQALTRMIDQGGVLNPDQIRSRAAAATATARRQVEGQRSSLGQNLASMGAYNPLAVEAATSGLSASLSGLGEREMALGERTNALSLPGLIRDRGNTTREQNRYRVPTWQDHRKRVNRTHRRPRGSIGASTGDGVADWLRTS